MDLALIVAATGAHARHGRFGDPRAQSVKIRLIP
jgi:hypothetical protein